MYPLFNLNSIRLMSKPFRFMFLVMLLGLPLLSAFGEKDTLKPEYRELMDIVESEKTLVERMQSDIPEEKLEAEIELRISTIIEAYKTYLENYPRNVFAKILYGKFLRKTNKPKEANEVFLEIHEDNPKIAVVNQNLALYAAEVGDYENAYKFFESSIALEPETALFHYQFGEFLYTYKNTLVKRQILTISQWEDKMKLSFRKAHKLEPENRDFHARWAESFFDVFQPDWNKALAIWDELISTSTNLFERDVMNLQKARVLIELSRYYEARELIEGVKDPALVGSKQKLLKQLP